MAHTKENNSKTKRPTKSLLKANLHVQNKAERKISDIINKLKNQEVWDKIRPKDKKGLALWDVELKALSKKDRSSLEALGVNLKQTISVYNKERQDPKYKNRQGSFDKDKNPVVSYSTSEELRDPNFKPVWMPAEENKEILRDRFNVPMQGPPKPSFAEGGDVDTQMAELMPDEQMPDEQMMEEPMVSDENMEDDYMDFIVSKALSNEEAEMLMEVLDNNPELSIIFDKLMDTATEFSGAGPVDGPGSEVSDSIPARLSDGEFVITAKAANEIGPDTLQDMMDGAEIASDNRQQLAMGGEIDEEKVDQYGKPLDKDIMEDEIRKDMMSINPRLR